MKRFVIAFVTLMIIVPIIGNIRDKGGAKSNPGIYQAPTVSTELQAQCHAAESRTQKADIATDQIIHKYEAARQDVLSLTVTLSGQLRGTNDVKVQQMKDQFPSRAMKNPGALANLACNADSVSKYDERTQKILDAFTANAWHLTDMLKWKAAMQYLIKLNAEGQLPTLPFNDWVAFMNNALQAPQPTPEPMPSLQ